MPFTVLRQRLQLHCCKNIVSVMRRHNSCSTIKIFTADQQSKSLVNVTLFTKYITIIMQK